MFQLSAKKQFCTIWSNLFFENNIISEVLQTILENAILPRFAKRDWTFEAERAAKREEGRFCHFAGY